MTDIEPNPVIGLLTQRLAPGVWGTSSTEPAELASTARGLGWHVYQVPLDQSTSKAALLERLRTTLHFPDHYRLNWDATADCLKDLPIEAGSRHLILVDAPSVQPSDPPASVFLSVLAEAVAYWARQRANLSVVWIGQPAPGVPRLSDL